MDELTLVRHLARIFNKKGFLVKTEIGAGYGIADLVLVKLDKAKCKVRQNNNQVHPLLKESYFAVLKHLPDEDASSKPLDYLSLLKKTHLSDHFLKYHVLKTLKSCGYVKEVDGNMFFKVNGWVPLTKEVIAIEAKLHDWRRGFIQANRYKAFADKAYLAIPECYLHRVNRELLMSQNIGLIALSDSRKTIKEEIKPSKNNLFIDDKRNYVAEHYLRNALAY